MLELATGQGRSMQRLWVERIQLADFRSYPSLVIETGPEIQVLSGANGAGKTNLLEAISLLVPGHGLRGAHYRDLARVGGDGRWSVAARVHSRVGPVDIGTGFRATPGGRLTPGGSPGATQMPAPGGRLPAGESMGATQMPAPSGRLPAGESLGATQKRILRIDGEAKGSPGILSEYLDAVWLTPAMDGLFTGPASERRNFLDRMIASLDPGYRTLANRFEKAMQSRNRLLADGVSDNAQLAGFEMTMAEAGVAMAAARRQAVEAHAHLIAERRARDARSAFPWATLALEGAIDGDLAGNPAVDVEDRYLRTLRTTRERDRAVGRTLDGPHRTDLVVGHGPKAMPARLSSSGEQKSLLLGLVLDHAELIRLNGNGLAPILLLDEVTAHLDEVRRAALFDEIGRLDAQAWMTGTDQSAFSSLHGRACFWHVEGGGVQAAPGPR